MEKTFEYESNHFIQDGYCEKFKVTVNIISHGEDEAEGEVVSIESMDTGLEKVLNDFPVKEYNEIEEQAQSIADDLCYEVYMDSQIARADFMVDCWKHED